MHMALLFSLFNIIKNVARYQRINPERVSAIRSVIKMQNAKYASHASRPEQKIWRSFCGCPCANALSVPWRKPATVLCVGVLVQNGTPHGLLHWRCRAVLRSNDIAQTGRAKCSAAASLCVCLCLCLDSRD